MNGNTLARVLIAAASMMFAASAAAQSPPQIGSLDTSVAGVNDIFPSGIPIINPNTSDVLTGVNITVSLPAGLTGVGTAFFDNASCLGNIAAGPATVTVTDGVIPPGQCILYVYHQGVTAGFYSLLVDVTSSVGSPTPNPQTLGTVMVYAMPTAGVSFSPARIAPGGVSTLSVEFANPDLNFTVNFDTIPPIGLGALVPGASIVEDPPGCASGEVPPYLGTGNSLNVIYINLPPGGACTVSIEVTGPALGVGLVSESHPVPDLPSAAFTPSLYYAGPPTFYIYPLPVPVPQVALTVVGPELGVSPLLLNTFPNTPVGMTWATEIVTVTNTGEAPLTFAGTITVTGNYSLASGCPEPPASLAPAASCDLSVTFTPLVTGGNPGSILIESDGGSMTVALYAAGSYMIPYASTYASPATVAPGSPATMELLVENPNGMPYESAGFTYTLPSGVVVAPVPNAASSASPCAGTLVPPTAGASSFAVTGLSVPPGNSCAFFVDVTAAASGTYVFEVPAGTISGQVANEINVQPQPTVTATLVVGVGPVLQVAPLSVVFPGVTPIGAQAGPVTVTVANIGDTPLTFSGSMARVGTFSASGNCPEPPATLAASASCALDVTFNPLSPGVQAASILIESDGGSATVIASGEGALIPPSVIWSFNPLSVISGDPSTLQLQINNSNGAPFDSPGFTYHLPPGLVAASSTFGYSASPCLGTMTQPAVGDTSFTVSGLSVPTFGACAYSIEVTSSAPGTYDVQMAPGTIVGSVLFQSGLGNALSNTISLVVTAAPAPVLSLSPAPPGPMVFGNVTVGSFSAFQTVTLTNAGDAPLTFSSMTATPPFELNAATATPCPSTLPAATAPGNTCTVEVKFAPTVVGPASGTLAIASDGGNASLSLTGTGEPVPVPAVSLSPTSLAFAAQTVGTVSGAQPVLLDNTGTAPLAISSITTGGDFAHSATCPLAPSTLAAGSGCDISVTFSPLQGGGRTGAVTITSNASGSPHQVSLSGTGSLVLVPALTVSPASLSFPQTQVGTPSAPASIQVTNSGTAPLSVSAVQVTGAGFGVTADGCTGTVAVGASCTVTVVFTPPVEGSLAATLEIVSNAPDSPTQVALSGRGSAAPLATLAVSPASLAFAAQTVDTTSPAQTVTVTNTGGATATISGITVSGDYAQTNNCASIPADGNCTVSVTFTPTASGARHGSIVLSGNASNSPVAITLTGSGVPPPLPVIELSVSSLSYGNTMVGRGAASQAFTLRNAGGVPLTLTGMGVPTEFPVSSGCPGVVPAGESCRIDVGFLPRVAGPRAGRLEITSNASNGTKGVDLSGTGCRFAFLGRSPALICQ